MSQVNKRHSWLQFWLQLAHFDLGSRSFAVVRRSAEPPAHQAFSDFGGHRRTPSGRPGSVGVRGSSPLSSTATITPFSFEGAARGVSGTAESSA